MLWFPESTSPEPDRPVEIARALPEEDEGQEQRILLAFMEKDVTGNGHSNFISLTGVKRHPADLAVSDVQVIVQDLQDNRYIQVPIGTSLEGYNPQMEWVDFDQDGIPDLFITIDSDPNGETQYYSMLTFKDGQAAKLVQPEQLNAGLDYQVDFQEGFKAELTRIPAGETVTIDIEARKSEHIKQGIYDDNGKLLKSMKGEVEGYSALKPIQRPDGTYLLEGRQFVYGYTSSDRLATITSHWAVQSGLFRLTELDVKPYDWDNEQSPQFAINDKFEEWLPNESELVSGVILDTRYADVNGDGNRDHILLVGKKDAMNEAYSSIKLMILSGSTGEWSSTSVGEVDAGYNPSLWIGHFNDDGVKDILVSIGNSRSGKRGGATYSLLTFAGGEMRPLVDQKQLNEGLRLDVKFVNGYKAEITNKDSSRKETLDVYPSKERYVRALVYDPQGKLMQPTEGKVGEFISLVPVDTQGDGIYQLKGTQIVAGAIHTEDLATVESIWSVRNGRMELVKETFTERK